jgi:hypothetical protein
MFFLNKLFIHMHCCLSSWKVKFWLFAKNNQFICQPMKVVYAWQRANTDNICYLENFAFQLDLSFSFKISKKNKTHAKSSKGIFSLQKSGNNRTRKNKDVFYWSKILKFSKIRINETIICKILSNKSYEFFDLDSFSKA